MSLHLIRDRAVDNFAARNPRSAIDPASIASFLELIQQLIAALQDCRKDPEEAVNMVKRPTRWQKRIVIRKVRRELGRRQYRAHGRNVVLSLLEAGKETTAEEMRAAYDDVD